MRKRLCPIDLKRRTYYKLERTLSYRYTVA